MTGAATSPSPPTFHPKNLILDFSNSQLKMWSFKFDSLKALHICAEQQQNFNDSGYLKKAISSDLDATRISYCIAAYRARDPNFPTGTIIFLYLMELLVPRRPSIKQLI
jgi:hypothetical protein